MPSISRKTTQYEIEARTKGWAWQYLDGTGQPKVTNYWHKDRYNADGILTFPAGSTSPLQPNEVDSNMRRAAKGLLPYPPNDTCLCEWCTAKRGTKAKVTYHQLLNRIPVVEEPREEYTLEGLSVPTPQEEPAQLKCPECEWVASGTPKQQEFRLTGHMKRHVKAMRL